MEKQNYQSEVIIMAIFHSLHDIWLGGVYNHYCLGVDVA